MTDEATGGSDAKSRGLKRIVTRFAASSMWAFSIAVSTRPLTQIPCYRQNEFLTDLRAKRSSAGDKPIELERVSASTSRRQAPAKMPIRYERASRVEVCRRISQMCAVV